MTDPHLNAGSSKAGANVAVYQPMAPAGTGVVALGDSVPRIDAVAKVTGLARYAAEYPAPDLVWGVVVNSNVAKGRIVRIDLEAARRVPGVKPE